MAKYDEILALAKETSSQITASAENWKRFLHTSAYNYQYAFTNQLLIFAQRPDATMVAPMAYWNDTAHRWVQRGTKGIALIAANEKRAALRYVFDLRDTYAIEHDRKVLPWEVTDTNRATLLQRYAEQAGAEQFTDALSMESAMGRFRLSWPLRTVHGGRSTAPTAPIGRCRKISTQFARRAALAHFP